MLPQTVGVFEISDNGGRHFATHSDVRCRGQDLPGDPIFDDLTASRMAGHDRCQTACGGLEQDARYSLAISGREADNVALAQQIGHVLDVSEKMDLAQSREIL